MSRWKQKALGQSGRARKGKSGTGNEELTGIEVARGGARQRAQRSRGTSADTVGVETEPGATGAAKEEQPGGSSNGRVARVYAPTQRARALELAAKVGVVKAAQRLGMSRFSVWDWKRKVKKASAGQGDSPTAGASSLEIEAQRDQEILAEWHRQPGLGPSQITNQLRRKGVKVAVHTVRRAMEEDGYRPPKVQRTAHDQRYESVRPNPAANAWARRPSSACREAPCLSAWPL